MTSTRIECPACHTPLDLHYCINVGPEIINEDGSKRITPRINFNILGVEPGARVAHIIETIGPSIRPGLKISELNRILHDEYNVRQVHIPMIIERIKEAYGLYTPDGKTLEMIK